METRNELRQFDLSKSISGVSYWQVFIFYTVRLSRELPFTYHTIKKKEIKREIFTVNKIYISHER